ncbi:hypothetical protein BDW22DRAFT_1169530 [Trametopsis cervina]|nr:hypothetical protein BDW22DRAFT_1169530 [Trametopsis cervina]
MPDSSTGVAVGASITVVFVVLLAGGLLTIYIRRRTSFARLAEPEQGDNTRTSVVLERSHPASRVTPFTPARQADVLPQFNRTPGEDMRIARRRSDGGWEFSSPLPSNILTTYALRPPGLRTEAGRSFATSRCTSPTLSSITLVSAPRNTKEKKLAPGELTTRGYVESVLSMDPDVSVDMLPPYSPGRMPKRNSHGYSQSSAF